MRSSPRKLRGASTLIMILAIGAALAASLYGAYSHMTASGKGQDTGSARTEARALAQDATAASAEYFNKLFCGSPSGACLNGNAGALSPTAVPAGLVLLNQANGANTMTARVVNNTFSSNGDIEVDAIGRTPTGSAEIRSYLHAATIYTVPPPLPPFALLVNGDQKLSDSTTVNTGSGSVGVRGNLTIGGHNTLTGSARATGTITFPVDSSNTHSCQTANSVCTADVATSSIPVPTINAYNLTGEANAILSLDAQGRPQVTFQNDSALYPAGTTLLSALPSTDHSLCENGGGRCIKYPFNNGWEVTSTPNPGVLFFYGDVVVDGGGTIGTAASQTPGYATIIATGNVLIGGGMDIVSYGQMPNVCNPSPSGPLPTNECPNGVNSTAPGEGTGQVANLVILSGGSVNYPYSGAVTATPGPGGTFNGTNGGTTSSCAPSLTLTPPLLGCSTQSEPSSTILPSGTATGYFCPSSAGPVGSGTTCPAGAVPTGIITGGLVTVHGNTDLTGVVAAGQSVIMRGTGVITGMIDTVNTSNLAGSLNGLQGNITINYAPGASNTTNFGGGGQVPMVGFVPQWERYVY